MERIAQDLNNPNVIEVPGAGFFSFLEFENDIWVMELRAHRRGLGNKVGQAMIEYAKKKGKNLWGKANPDGTGMSLERCKRWYASYGAVPVQMNEENPHAFRLEVK